MNHNGYSNVSLPTLLIEKVARLIDVRTMQLSSVSNVLRLWCVLAKNNGSHLIIILSLQNAYNKFNGYS